MRPGTEKALSSVVWVLLGMTATLLLSACASPETRSLDVPPSGNPDDLLIVDCLLPGQVRRLGSKVTYLSPRRAIKTPAQHCEIRGGEYVAYDRADAGSSLKIWLPQAEEGDAQAQTYVGEIFEKGLGVEPDYLLAASWYQRAAAQNHARAQINLGYLYEAGLGVAQDLPEAMNLYRRASGIEDGTLEYVSTVEFAHREQARNNASRLQARVEDLSQQLADSEARYRNTQARARADQEALESLQKQTEAKREAVRVYYEAANQSPPDSAQALMDIESISRQLARASEQNATLDAQLSASRDELRSLRQTMDVSRLQGKPVTESTVQAVAAAEGREMALSAAAAEHIAVVTQLEGQKAQLQARYERSIDTLQSELDLSVTEQTRVAGRLADAELSMASMSEENQQLRARLREQNAAVVAREQEQQRLSVKLSALALSARASDDERRAAEATTRVANAELALARFEQSRLVTRLVEAELDAQQSSQKAARELAILEKQLATQSGIVVSRQQQLDSLEQSVTQARAGAQTRPAESVAQVVAAGPVIEIIDPPVLITRGPAEIPGRSDGSIGLVGRVSPADNLLAFSINGQRQSLDTSGVFDFRSTAAVDQLELLAIDKDGERTHVSVSIAQRTQSLQPVEKAVSRSGRDLASAGIQFGRYHAIIIGNNRYTGMSSLRTAESDARVIDSVLRERYGFTTDLLINATKLDMLHALNSAQSTLTEQDNLIIYYAGHGQLDAGGTRGYWLPVDADINNTENWISNTVVTNYLDSIPAKQIMVVADSCFSGTLTQASIPRTQEVMPDELRTRWLKLMAKRKVRTVLSSGGIKPVYDGTSEHSLFAGAFIDELSRNQGVLEGYRLFSAVQGDVQRSAYALGVDQTPQYAAVKHAGHEVGEFLLVSR